VCVCVCVCVRVSVCVCVCVCVCPEVKPDFGGVARLHTLGDVSTRSRFGQNYVPV